MRLFRCLQLESGLPDVPIEKEEARPQFGFGKAKLGLQQRARRVDVEESDARQGARPLPTVEPASRGYKGHLAVPRAKMRPRQPVDKRLAVVPFGALGRD